MTGMHYTCVLCVATWKQMSPNKQSDCLKWMHSKSRIDQTALNSNSIAEVVLYKPAAGD